jgi:hypothetical protein
MKLKIHLPDAAKIMRERGLEPGGKVSREVGEQVIALSRPYVPVDTGRLAASGTTDGKSVTWNAPYAHAQYYGVHGRSDKRQSGRGLRGPYWFERMKADRMDEIIKVVAGMVGGKAK